MYCFTRNFEDVMIQRVLADVSQGCYIDVGASDPTNDSNTFALYLKGWRGVAIEPLPFQQLWQQRRPEDIFLCAGVGESSGLLTLQVYDQSQQISSGSEDTVAHWQRCGVQPTRCMEVPMFTLNQVIAEYAPNRPLHLLSVDVEGMEYNVLKGLDMQIHRPWVLIVEATLPGCSTPVHQEWEPYILGHGYLLAYADGVNRFYLAQEHRNLLGRFALPPNVWDDFVMAKQIELEAQVKQLEAQIADLQSKLV
jgi:FkbM family methyltransferase